MGDDIWKRAWGSHEFTQVYSLRGHDPKYSELRPLCVRLSGDWQIFNAVCRAPPLRGLLLTSHSDTTISGGIAIQAGFLVSFKQLVPEHTVAIAKGLIRMRVKHFPAIFLLTNTISGLVLGTETAMFLAYFGFMTAWIYLRFFRISPLPLVRCHRRRLCDQRRCLRHVSPLPTSSPSPSRRLSPRLRDVVYSTLITLGVCTPFSVRRYRCW